MLEPNENFSRLDLAFAGFLTQRVTASLDSNQERPFTNSAGNIIATK